MLCTWYIAAHHDVSCQDYRNTLLYDVAESEALVVELQHRILDAQQQRVAGTAILNIDTTRQRDMSVVESRKKKRKMKSEKTKRFFRTVPRTPIGSLH